MNINFDCYFGKKKIEIGEGNYNFARFSRLNRANADASFFLHPGVNGERVIGGNVQLSSDNKTLTLQLQLEGVGGPQGPHGGQGAGAGSRLGGIDDNDDDDDDDDHDNHDNKDAHFDLHPSASTLANKLPAGLFFLFYLSLATTDS